jgi:hypothetical protein
MVAKDGVRWPNGRQTTSRMCDVSHSPSDELDDAVVLEH